MKNRTLGVLAVLLGAGGTLLQHGSTRINAQLAPETIPGWAVYGTVGSSVVAYYTIITTIATLLMVLLAIGIGYTVGRRLDVAQEYRRIVKTVVAGSSGGVALVYLVTSWSFITPIGSGTTPSTFYTREMHVMDVLLPILALGQMLAEVALIVTIGMLTGAALAQFRGDDQRPANPTETDTDAPSAATRSDHDTPSEPESQPTQ